ncbi:hypothetical protein E6O75_ATG09962 [Venturia nashicola]|uniref:Uncharacterized protein n=1 Tax=Venturia nashicola TaxID=86259 RepID=A0A4Z1NWG9_9PEZI|nr:hypothetical protein E6O75_ATG09962 [Venturia nashicola]
MSTAKANSQGNAMLYLVFAAFCSLEEHQLNGLTNSSVPRSADDQRQDPPEQVTSPGSRYTISETADGTLLWPLGLIQYNMESGVSECPGSTHVMYCTGMLISVLYSPDTYIIPPRFLVAVLQSVPYRGLRTTRIIIWRG